MLSDAASVCCIVLCYLMLPVLSDAASVYCTVLCYLMQVTRKDISQMTVQDIANFGQSGGRDTQRSDQSGGRDTQRSNQSGASEISQSSTIKSDISNKTREKKFTPNNFEHRHQAQQKILETQQKQIKEQQRLIEELQYVQHQQIFTQQLAQQHTPSNHGNHAQLHQLKVSCFLSDLRLVTMATLFNTHSKLVQCTMTVTLLNYTNWR